MNKLKLGLPGVFYLIFFNGYSQGNPEAKKIGELITNCINKAIEKIFVLKRYLFDRYSYPFRLA